MYDGEVIIEVDADARKAEEEIANKLNEISKKRVELDIQIANNSKIKADFFEIKNLIDSIVKPTPEINAKYNELFNAFSDGKQKVFSLRNEINQLNQEYNKLLNSDATKSIPNELNKLNKALAVSNFLVSNFGRRIYNLLKGALIFNVLSRGFRGLSTLLGNIINRDTILAKTLIVIRANLIRAFAPVWQIILPIIRALGEGIVWITNQLIRFINFLTGSNIKPLNIGDWKEAKQVVGDFYKEVSPKKDMFPNISKADTIKSQVAPSKKVKDNIKKTRDNFKKTKKESHKLLASFDKLEVLSKKNLLGNDEFGNKKLKESLDGAKDGIKDIIDEVNNSKIDLDVNEPSIESKIMDAINSIENAPLDFTVSDNLEDQILTKVNGLELPTLDFKANDGVSAVIENIKSKLSGFGQLFERVTKWLGENKWLWKSLAAGIAAIGTAFAYANIGKWVGEIVKWATECFKWIGGIGKAMKIFIGLFSGPGGWAALIVGALVLIALNFNKIKESAMRCFDWIKSNAYSSFQPLITTFQSIKALIGFVQDKFHDLLTAIGKGVSKFGSLIGKVIGVNTEIEDSSFESYVSLKSPPRLAQGAVLRGGDPFLAYLNDQPRGQTNIEAPLSTIVDAFKEAISESGMNQAPQISIKSEGNMSEFIRALNLKIQDEQIRVGKNFVEGL